MDAALERLRSAVRDANAARRPLRLRGAGTKDFYGESFDGELLSTRDYAGIVDYDASELVITARCGTPLSEINRALESHRQCLGFEPPAFGGVDPTMGGIIATGLSGPRRMQAGAVRNFVLGTTLLTADGELLRFGGRVMKNVAGFDVSRLLCGSLGTLGVITEVSLRLLPSPRTEQTLRLQMSAPEAVTTFNHWCGQPLPVSGTAWLDGQAWVRLSGSPQAVRGARERIGGEIVDEPQASAFWRNLRDQTHRFFSDAASLWRFSVPSTAPALDFGAPELIEWNGALRWQQTTARASTLRAAAEAAGGTAMHWRGAAPGTMFHPLSPAVLDIHRRLKQRFDSHGIFNPGRLITDL